MARALGHASKVGAILTMAIVMAASGGSARAAVRDWPTFGGSLSRQGHARGERAPSPATAPNLRALWRTPVGGAVNTQPLLAHGVRVGKRRRDLVYVGTEHGRVAALDARTGRVVWSRRLGAVRNRSACAPGPDEVLGVTGTPAIDRRTNRLYVVDGRGRAWALGLGSGRPAQGWPVRLTRPRSTEYVWGALAVSRGRLYVTVASPCDQGMYRGGIAAVAVRHPSHIRRWHTVARPLWAGGIWGWGGASIDARTGDVFVATGNALGGPEDAGDAESVVRLGARLHVRQSSDPLRAPYAIGDRDFGTTPVLFQAAGCPPQLVALDKTGELFLYNRRRIAAGPVQRLVVGEVTAGGIPLIGLPAVDAGRRTLVLLTPADAPAAGIRTGLVALRLTRRCRLTLAWNHADRAAATGSAPTIAGGVVDVATGRDGRLRAYALADGRSLWSRELSLSGAFSTPAVVDGTVYAADWSGGVWAFRAPARK
jgi:hypothetical protein